MASHQSNAHNFFSCSHVKYIIFSCSHVIYRGCLVCRKKHCFPYLFSIFCGTYHKKLVWFVNLYSIFIFKIQKKKKKKKDLNQKIKTIFKCFRFQHKWIQWYFCNKPKFVALTLSCISLHQRLSLSLSSHVRMIRSHSFSLVSTSPFSLVPKSKSMKMISLSLSLLCKILCFLSLFN